MPQQHPPHVRAQALFLIGKQGATAEQAARELDVNVNTVRAWWRDHREATGIAPAVPRHAEHVKQQALALVFEQGTSVAAAANELGLVQGTVQAWAETHRAQHNLPPPETGYPRALREQALRLVLEQGQSNTQAAKELGLPMPTVAHWAKEHRARHNLPPAKARHPEHARNEAVRLVLEDGLTQAQAAKQIGASESSVNLWTTNRLRTLHDNPDELRALAVRLVAHRQQPLPSVVKRLRVNPGDLVRWLHESQRAKRGRHR